MTVYVISQGYIVLQPCIVVNITFYLFQIAYGNKDTIRYIHLFILL